MGCRSRSQPDLSSSIFRGALYLAVLLVILLFGMIKGVDGVMGSDLIGDTIHDLHITETHHVQRRSLGLGRTVTLSNECTHKEVQVIGRRINALGKVRRRPRSNPQAQLLMTSQGDFGKVTIQSDRSKEYICFSSQGKLTTRTTKTGGDCIFKELAEHGKYKYQSVAHPQWYLGFKPNGKKLKGDLYIKKSRLGTCYYFMKPPLRGSGEGRDINAPDVDFDLYNPYGRGRHQRPRHRDSQRHRPYSPGYRGYSPNSNKNYAPKIDLNKITLRRLRHGRLRKRPKS